MVPGPSLSPFARPERPPFGVVYSGGMDSRMVLLYVRLREALCRTGVEAL